MFYISWHPRGHVLHFRKYQRGKTEYYSCILFQSTETTYFFCFISHTQMSVVRPKVERYLSHPADNYCDKADLYLEDTRRPLKMESSGYMRIK